MLLSVSGFSGFFGSTLSVPLPVNLLSFTAAQDGQRNRIDWSTAVETSGTRFDITRSADGGRFISLGTIAGKGNHSAYTYYDESPLAPVSYYRLQSTETDGTVSFSSIAIVRRNTAGGSVTVAPLPARSTVVVTSTDATLNGQQAGVWSSDGRMVYAFTMTSQQQIDVSGWAPGIYSLKLPSGEVVRITKQ